MTGRSRGIRLLLQAGLLVACGTVQAQDHYAVDAPAGRVIPATYFGQHIHNLVLRGRVQDPPQPTPWPQGEVGALRLWDTATRWAELEPRSGEWDFKRLDAFVAQAQRAGVPVLYTLGSTPRWASARPDEPCSYGFGCAAEPADLALWERYVATLARRYKGRIALYELWNEPHPGQSFKETGFYNGSNEMLVELARRARAVLQREDPSAQLLSPGFVNRIGPFEQYLAAGGGAWVQGLAYHFYSGSDRQLLEVWRQVKAVQSRQGLAALPLYNTEAAHEGFEGAAPAGYTPRSRTEAAELDARSWILGAVAGLERWYHHAWDNRYTGMVTATLQPTPAQTAWHQVRRWLVGARPEQCRSLAVNLLRCTFRPAGGGRLWILWRPEPGPTLEWLPPADFKPQAGAYAVAGGPAPLPAAGEPWRIGSDPLALWDVAPKE